MFPPLLFFVAGFFINPWPWGVIAAFLLPPIGMLLGFGRYAKLIERHGMSGFLQSMAFGTAISAAICIVAMFASFGLRSLVS